MVGAKKVSKKSKSTTKKNTKAKKNSKNGKVKAIKKIKQVDAVNLKKLTTSIVSISNQKGGVAKTTSTVTLACSFSEKNRKVLLIDGDGQGNSCSAFKDLLNPSRSLKTRATLDKKTLDKGLLSSSLTIDDLKYPAHKNGNLDVVCANNDLKKLGRTEVGTAGSQNMLKRLLDRSDLSKYEIILIDTPPNIGLLFQNAIYASHYYMIPLTAENDPFEGVGDMFDEIRLIKSENTQLRCLGVLITNYFPNRIATHAVLQPLIENFVKKIKVPYLGEIPFSSAVSSSSLAKTPIPFRKEVSSSAVALAYANLADVLEKEFKGARRGNAQATPSIKSMPSDLIDPIVPHGSGYKIDIEEELVDMIE